MKIKKRHIFVLILALALVLSVGTISAFAADNDPASHGIAGNKFEGAERAVYNKLSDFITKVASGEVSETTIDLKPSDILNKTVFTAQDLGVEKLADESGTGISSAAQQKLDELSSVDVEKVAHAVEDEHPYEAFWIYNLTVGEYGFDFSYDPSDDTVKITDKVVFSVTFGTIKEVSPNRELCDEQVDPEIMKSMSKVKGVAAQIVEECKGLDDFHKLKEYRRRICEMVNYDYETAAGDIIRGLPYTLINVFDGDENTLAVCEGYAEAFKYLCDLTDFDNDSIYCILVWGNMDGCAHQWNLVHMDDGKNYHCDITNSDYRVDREDTTFDYDYYPYENLLRGAPYDASNQLYNYLNREDEPAIEYRYAPVMTKLYSNDELAVSDKDYVPVSIPLLDGARMNDTTLFKYVGKASEVTVPDGITKIIDFAFEENNYIEKVTLPYGVTSIGSSAFGECPNLKTVIIPETVTSIGGFAFADSGITSLSLPDSVTELEEFALSDLKTISYLKWPAGITKIPDRQFYDFKTLKSIEIPDAITSIGSEAFCNCESLAEVKLPDNLESIGFNAFECCTKLEKVEFGSKLKTIGSYAFAESGLKELNLPDSLIKIEEGAFDACKGITKLVLPKELKTIGDYAFMRCSGLKELVLNDKLTKIGESAFCSSPLIKKIWIPDSVEKVGEGAFEECSKAQSIALPAKLQKLGYQIFSPKCKSTLLEVAIPAKDKSLVNTTKLKKLFGFDVKPYLTYGKPGEMLRFNIGKISDKTFTGRAIKPTFTIKYDGTKLIKGKDYTVTYKNNINVGTATVTIKCTGKVNKTLKKTFKIIPKGTSIVKLKALKKGMEVTCRKQSAKMKTSRINGYEVCIATNSKFTKNETSYLLTSYKYTALRIDRLKANKTYYVKARTYKKVKGKKYYSAWSKVKKVKTR